MIVLQFIPGSTKILPDYFKNGSSISLLIFISLSFNPVFQFYKIFF